jgi:hypothetical protein
MSNLWTRVLGLGAVAIIAALLLKFLPPIIVLALFVTGIALVYTTGRKRARAPELRAGTDLLGLKREAGDPFDILGFPLALFGRVNAPEVGELVWGRWRGIDVYAFELSWDPPSPTGEVPGRAAFACVVGAVGGQLPGLVAEPQSFLTLLQSAAPGARIELGDPWLDASMNAWTDDEAAARRMLDDSARHWLRSLDLQWGIEVRAQMAAIYGPKPQRADLVGALEVLRDLLEHLPAELAEASPPA